MALTKVTGKGIENLAVDSDKLANSSVTSQKLGSDSVTSAKISDGVVSADDLASTLDLSSKTVTLPSSTLAAEKGQIQDNIALLGFKMAVNDGLTVFNLVDGVVDEFNDESGTDESEGSNDTYCATGDFYRNAASICISAGFSTTAITEPDTSTAGTNPAYGCGTYGEFTVPCGVTSINISAWGAAGGSSGPQPAGPFYGIGGGGGYVAGTLAVTSGQIFDIVVGEGGSAQGDTDSVVRRRALGGGGTLDNTLPVACNGYAGGGGLSGVFAPGISINTSPSTHTGSSVPSCGPKTYMVAGAGGGGGQSQGANVSGGGFGGNGGGLTGDAAGPNPAGALEQTNRGSPGEGGGGGDQEQGGQGGTAPSTTAYSGQFLQGGDTSTGPANTGGGGSGYYGGGGGASGGPPFNRSGGGGSSYYSHPQVTSGSTEEGNSAEGGGVSIPTYVASTNEGVASPKSYGEDGYVLLTSSGIGSTTSTTIVSTAFTSNSVATSARIVVFEEDVDSPTLNTDIIASVSRDGTNFTNATLSDSGYVTGSSGQRILTGQADISGQPSGQSMRWKLALANNTVKIHGVALQWS